MPVEGRIADRTKAILPITWDALLGDARFGDAALQTALDTAKFGVTGAEVSTTAEGLYSVFVIDYIAKVTALELIPPGIDYWMNTPISESATGTNENETWTDRAEALRKLGEQLLRETRDKADEIALALGYVRPSAKSRPLSLTQDDEFLTPSHQEFPRPYVVTDRS